LTTGPAQHCSRLSMIKRLRFKVQVYIARQASLVKTMSGPAVAQLVCDSNHSKCLAQGCKAGLKFKLLKAQRDTIKRQIALKKHQTTV
jgi:hypothetical protein